MKKKTLAIAILLLLLAACDISNAPSGETEPQTPSASAANPSAIARLTRVPPSPLAISLDKIERVQAFSRFGKGVVYQAAWTPNGRRLALATSLGVYFYDLQNWQQTQFIETRSPVLRLAMTSDSALLAMGLGNGSITLWDLNAGRERRTLIGHTRGVDNLVFAANNTLMASAGRDKTVILWDVSAGRERERRRLSEHSDTITSIAFAPDGKTLATASADATVRLWDVTNDRSAARMLSEKVDEMDDLMFAPDGKTLAAVGLGDTGVHLWDVATGRERATLQLPDKDFSSLVYAIDSKQIFTGINDGTLRVWDATTGRELRILTTTFATHELTLSPDGRLLLSINPLDSAVQVWDVVSGKLARGLNEFSGSFHHVAISLDGSKVLVGGYLAKLWDLNGGRELRALTGWSVAFASDNDLYATTGSGEDRTIKLWSIAGGREKSIIRVDPSLAYNVAFAPDGKFFVAGLEDGKLKFWDAASGRELRTLAAHGDAVRRVTFSGDGLWLATGSEDGTVKLWQRSAADGLSWQEKRSLGKFDGGPARVALSHDGQWVAVAAYDSISVWDVAGKDAPRKFVGHKDLVLSAAFSPDGKILATSGEDNTVRLWELASGNELKELQGHTDFVSDVAFSADGRWLVSSSWDGTVRVWGVK